MSHLSRLRDRTSRRIIGLNSGTSVDGIDAAIVDFEGAGLATRVAPVAFTTSAVSDELRARLKDAASASAAELCHLNFLVGEAFAAAAQAVLDEAGLSAGEVDLVASHGQTVVHLPPSAGYTLGSSLQIGEPAVIAERLGLPVICDFRVRDLAAGGEGAPLVPLADYYLFRRPGQVRGLQNIGGIANVTVVPDRLEGVFAFDTGPGNMALDEVARVASGGTARYDAGGAMAARGRVDEMVLAELLSAPFFAQPPPRSTGRERFGAAWLAPLLHRYRDRLPDLLATLTRFTAEAIRLSYARFVEPRAGRVTDVVVSGGGVHNATLMAHLSQLFDPAPVRSSADEGIDPDAKEAIAFALLANETLHGLPGNIPAATGARGPRVLGKIVPA
jgi:anhydro-N-acetylmuramic acid kinase